MSFIAAIYFFPDVAPPLSVEEESKPTEINIVNSGKRKMFNDCDHTCLKAIGFSYPGVVLHCFECESEKKWKTTWPCYHWRSKGHRERQTEGTCC